MTRQVQNPQGRTVKPLHATLFVLALLVFVFTVIYRMIKSESFNSAVATLVESLLIVSFFVFFGILFAYLIYFLHDRIRKRSRRLASGDMIDGSCTGGRPACTPDSGHLGLEPGDEAKSRPRS